MLKSVIQQWNAIDFLPLMLSTNPRMLQASSWFDMHDLESVECKIHADIFTRIRDLVTKEDIINIDLLISDCTRNVYPIAFKAYQVIKWASRHW